jgi:hypothetical protein
MSAAATASGFAIGLVAGAASMWLVYVILKPTIPGIVARAVRDQVNADPMIPSALKPIVITLAGAVAVQATRDALP